MIQDGAQILDIGGMSTRPGAIEISEEEEIARVIPLIKQIRNTLPKVLLSIDTYRSSVAEQAFDAGVDICNDISGGRFDPNIINITAKYRAPFIAMHTPSKSISMQKNPEYDHVVSSLMAYFSERLQTLQASGITDIILDLGFGFGKTIAHNYTLLNQIEAFSFFNRPILVGISRKSMISKTLNTEAQHALNGTTALHMKALEQGAHILRVHDVKEAVECISLHKILNQYPA
jgi:dihydropteroate synthase